MKIPDHPACGNLLLSKEAISIVAGTIREAAAADNFADALEIGYRGAGEIACTAAALEGISAFLQK
jgi:enoyl-CoA hydratase/3-hydroxyacyl-CoA dehydrogenase